MSEAPHSLCGVLCSLCPGLQCFDRESQCVALGSHYVNTASGRKGFIRLKWDRLWMGT